MTTNYRETLITVSADCPVTTATVPGTPGSIARLQYELLTAHPYALTSDDLLFEVHARRTGVAPADREAARMVFFSRPQACLRTSPLVKSFGWGLHHDENSRVAAIGKETEVYRTLSDRPDLTRVPGMRSKRAR